MKKSFSKVISNILIGISYILVLASLYLTKLAKSSLGVHRDLSFRNEKLYNTILSDNLIVVYKILVMVGVIWGVYRLFNTMNINRNKMIKIFFTCEFILVGLVLEFMLFNLKSAPSLAFPWIVIALIILYIAELYRSSSR